MERLFIILSGTLLFVTCPINSGHQRAGYYIPGEYNIYSCKNISRKYITEEEVQVHELGRLYWFMYLKKIGISEEQERYANQFASCATNEKCLPALIRKIKTTLNI